MRPLLSGFCLIFALALMILNSILYWERRQPNQTAFIVPPPRWMEQDDIYRMNPDGSNPVRLTNDRYLETHIQASPQGDWIIFRSAQDQQASLQRIDLNGFQRQTIMRTEGNYWHNLAEWSPDGKSLTYLHKDGSLSFIGMMQVDGSEKHPLTTPVGQCNQPTDIRNEYNPRWLDNWIYFNVAFCNSSHSLYRIRPDGSERQEIMPLGGGETCWTIAPDHQTIFYRTFSDRWSIVHYDIASRIHTPITAEGDLLCDEQLRNTHPNWFFFITNQFSTSNVELYRAAWDGSVTEKITPTPRPLTMPLLAQDGKWLYFEGRNQGKLEVYRMHIDGSGIENLTQNLAHDSPISMSPDSKWVYFTSDRTGKRMLYRMHTDGSAVQQLPIYSRRRVRDFSLLVWLPLADKPWHHIGQVSGSVGLVLIGMSLAFRRSKES